jgi:hypothetical protein
VPTGRSRLSDMNGIREALGVLACGYSLTSNPLESRPPSQVRLRVPRRQAEVAVSHDDDERAQLTSVGCRSDESFGPGPTRSAPSDRRPAATNARMRLVPIWMRSTVSTFRPSTSTCETGTKLSPSNPSASRPAANTSAYSPTVGGESSNPANAHRREAPLLKFAAGRHEPDVAPVAYAPAGVVLIRPEAKPGRVASSPSR